MHHALSIAEILHLISTFCDPPTNAATALVCKQWSEESLNVLWYRVDDLENLLLLFGEMYTDHTGSYHFEDEIAHDTWHRFQNVYQHRIRSLYLGEPSLFHHPLGSLRRIRMSGSLLPNLHSLSWNIFSNDDAQAEEHGKIFMDKSIETFTFAAYNGPNPIGRHFRSWCSSILARMPNLTCLELFIGPFIEYQISLMNLIQNLRNLRELVIPPFPDLSIILTGISNLDSSKLSDLKIYIDPGHDPTTTINLAGATGNGLKNLAIFRLYSSYIAASQVFVDHLHLEDTSFVSYDPASAAEIRELLSRIAQTCSTMEEVALSFENTQTEVINRLKASPAHIITFDVLRPLLSCSKIRSFEVDVLHPLSLDDADIELFAQSCPCLETLYLGPVPGILASDNLKKLSFRSLLHLALHCPQIRNLYLYLDAEHIPEGFENVSATATFTRLCYFGVGFSPIQDPAQVARVLASFLPPTVFFSWGPSSGQSLQWEDVDLISLSINTTWDQHWKAVLPSSDGANANDWKGKYVRGV